MKGNISEENTMICRFIKTNKFILDVDKYLHFLLNSTYIFLLVLSLKIVP